MTDKEALVRLTAALLPYYMVDGYTQAGAVQRAVIAAKSALEEIEAVLGEETEEGEDAQQ